MVGIYAMQSEKNDDVERLKWNEITAFYAQNMKTSFRSEELVGDEWFRSYNGNVIIHTVSEKHSRNGGMFVFFCVCRPMRKEKKNEIRVAWETNTQFESTTITVKWKMIPSNINWMWNRKSRENQLAIHIASWIAWNTQAHTHRKIEHVSRQIIIRQMGGWKKWVLIQYWSNFRMRIHSAVAFSVCFNAEMWVNGTIILLPLEWIRIE